MAASKAATRVGQPALDAEHVDVSFGGVPVLQDVGIRVCPGEAVAVVGGNGSGKSTFIRALMGLIPHQHGEIHVFGEALESFSEHSRIGYVPQQSQIGIPSATVWELVSSGRLAHNGPFRWVKKEDKQAIAKAIELVGLSDRQRWPFGVLSGGQKQRVLIARALATGPDLLVMDEPMAGVDLHSQAGLAELMQRLVDGGLGLLVVLHELGAMAPVLDRFITLCDGRIVPGESYFGAGPSDSVEDQNQIGLRDPFGNTMGV